MLTVGDCTNDFLRKLWHFPVEKNNDAQQVWE